MNIINTYYVIACVGYTLHMVTIKRHWRQPKLRERDSCGVVWRSWSGFSLNIVSAGPEHVTDLEKKGIVLHILVSYLECC